MRKILITGASGFIGTALRSLLLQEDLELTTLSRSNIPSKNENMRHYTGDVLDHIFVESILKAREIDTVFHLAGGRAEKNLLSEVYKLNTLTTASLFDAVINYNPNIKCIIVSSSAVYGNGRTGYEGEKISEKETPSPLENYAESKIASEFIAQQAYIQNKVPIIIARIFNIIGPGQSDQFVTGKIIKHMANRVVKKTNDILNLGPVSLSRDFLDIRDVANALVFLMKKGNAGEIYNVCSGLAHKIKSIIDEMETLTGIECSYTSTETLENKEVKITQQIGCNEKILNATGWQPRIDFKRSLFDQLNAKIEEVKKA